MPRPKLCQNKDLSLTNDIIVLFLYPYILEGRDIGLFFVRCGCFMFVCCCCFCQSKAQSNIHIKMLYHPGTCYYGQHGQASKNKVQTP